MPPVLHTLAPTAPLTRILVRGVNWLGDAVMTTPALLRLREAWPKAHIVLLCPVKLETLFLHHLAVDAVLGIQPLDTVWSIARQLRRGQFEAALVLPNSPRSALEVFLAGIPRRIGYARPWRNWFLTERVQQPAAAMTMRKRSDTEIRNLVALPTRPASSPLPQAHHIFQYLHLAAALGASTQPMAPHITVIDSELAAAHARLQAAGPSPPFWLGLNAGAEYGAAKRWPEERFAAVARRVHEQTRCGCVLLGGRADVAIARRIAERLTGVAPVVNLAGQTSLRELCAVLAACQVVLTNDSGPMHVAAAVGTPVVVPFGSTSPELTGPGLPGSPGHVLFSVNAPCSPCFRPDCPIDFRCMTQINEDDVAAAVRKLAGVT